MITDEDMDKVSGIAQNVSEIESVEIGEFDVKNAKSTEDKDEAVPAPAAKEEAKAAPAAAPSPAAAKPAAAPAAAGGKKPVGKPVVNRTVRVDIEKLDVLMNLVSELIIAKNSLISATTSSGATNVGCP